MNLGLGSLGESDAEENAREFFLCFLKIEHLEWILSSSFSHAVAAKACRDRCHW
jgi:hypothetical protein